MKGIALVFTAAVLIQGLIQVFKAFLPDDKELAPWVWASVSMALGLVFCILGDIDLVKEAGLVFSVPYVGNIITGILVSRGSNFLHDVWSSLDTEDSLH